MMVDRAKFDALLGLLAGYVGELRRLAAIPRGRFRNRLVHVYWHVDDGLIADYLQSHLDEFDRFTACLARLF